ncbi:hypothetical protein NTD84_14545 [Pseudomonas sp. 14P_8.1_Bac3]|uniref:hypothetical protein n=1 Tax=Pseudomonas sp. 14P_8.1_Bac3 TaxID=2971621 RepID=UPI0021C70314|nr:hypothetical protein [Pseudomonas sp. 14P_8.1_Bac3]MCU1760928.1 hypothetical protein [Pseudomonas sp. 14P_8.1_Bac3]
MATQLFLDRGEQLGWFSSMEIVLEAVIALSALYVFLAHTFTAKDPFISLALFKDRNFSLSVVFIFIIGITYLASLALMTPYLQNLMGYPVLKAGLAMGPRGLGTMATMYLAGRLISQVDTRWLLFWGLALSAGSMWLMTGWTPQVWRNVGSSVGISIVTVLLVQNTQVNHEQIGAHITGFNRLLHAWPLNSVLDPVTESGRAMLDGMISTQALWIAYLDDFKLLMLLSLAVMPLLLIIKPPAMIARDDHGPVLE